MTSLKRQTISGIKWIAFNNYIQKALSVCTFIILARMLEPKIFGLFAMAFVAIDCLHLFKTLGVDTALVQRKDDIELAAHTAFSFIPLLGIVVFLFVYFFAPYSAILFHEPALTPIVRMLGLIFVLGAIGNVPQALLTKQMRFKELVNRDLLAAFFYSLSAILLAYLKFGIWSLVYAYIFRTFLSVVLSWLISGYKPKLKFDKRIAVELLSFGKFILGSSIIVFLISNIDNFFVGRMLGATILGYYALAFNISNFTAANISSLINRVIYPAYAKMQDDRNDIKKASLKVIKYLSVFAFPFGLILLLLSNELVLLIYGNKWLPMVPALKILALGSMFLPLISIAPSVFRACGKPKLEFNLSLFRIILMLIGIPVMVVKFGLTGAAIAVTFSNLIQIPITFRFLARLLNLKFTDALTDLKPAIISSIVMGFTIFSLKFLVGFELINFANKILFGFSLLGFAALYLFVFYFLDRTLFKEIKLLIVNH